MPLLGNYMARVFRNERVFLTPVFGPLERVTYRVLRTDPDRDLGRRIIDVQNQKLGELSKAYPGRVYGFASVALQFPELAAEQLETGMKEMGLKGGAIG